MEPNVRLFANFLVRVLPPDVAFAVGTRIAEAMEAAFVSPLTMMANIEAILGEAVGAIKVEEVRHRLAEDLPSLWFEWAQTQAAADAEQLNRAIGCSATRHLLHALLDMFVVAEDKARYYEVLRLSLAEIDPLKAAAALGGLFNVPGAESIAFEHRVRLTATAVAELAECYYKPSLSACFRLTMICAGRDCDVPNTLGVLVARCRDAWSIDREELIPLLMDDVCIIRNSEAHVGTVIDPRLRTVTFVNTTRNGERRELGPLSGDDYDALLHRIEKEFLALHSALHCAFRRIWMAHQMTVA